MSEIENYGYVPFTYFQYVVLAFQVWMIYNYKMVNEYMDSISYFSANPTLKKIVLSIPLISIIYYDIRYSSFSLKNLGVPPNYNDTIKQILNIVGSYALIHIFAQDTGLKTSVLQQDYLQTHLLFVIISVGMAFSITQNRSQSIIAAILFYHLRYVIGNDIVSIVQ